MTRLAGNQMTLGGQALYGKAEFQLDGRGLLAGSSPGNVIGWLPAASAQTSFALGNGDTWRLGAGVQHALSPKSDLGGALEYARSQSSSDPSALVSGRYDHPTLFFMAVNYSHRF